MGGSNNTNTAKGKITEEGKALERVTLVIESKNPGISKTTDASGKWQATNLSGNITVTP